VGEAEGHRGAGDGVAVAVHADEGIHKGRERLRRRRRLPEEQTAGEHHQEAGGLHFTFSKMIR
jgi:hypothetical protein